ncbi:MAG TPA: uracil-DNA glycosylase [Acidimicrobiia bacterium]|nr:uracil-DNA glycosylase [Acidimicrobiia bacterium]
MSLEPLLSHPAFAAGDSLPDVARAAATCTLCTLAPTRTQVVFGSGTESAELMFVGEGPGEQEDLQGLPFVGRSGQLLTRLIEGIGLTRDDVYIANVVKCRPPGNRDPQPAEVAACSPWLDRQLQLVEPRVLVTLGKHATHLVLDTKVGITKLRGQQFPLERAGVRAVVIPTLHPAFVLRGGGAALAEARADFVKIKRALGRAA